MARSAESAWLVWGTGALAALAQTPHGHGCDLRPHSVVPLEQLFGDPEQTLAPVHLLPDLFRVDAGSHPEDDQVVEKVGALAHDRIVIAVERVDHDLESFLAELLRHLGAPGL